MTETVDFPNLVLVVERAAGQQVGIEADFTESSGVVVLAAERVRVVRDAGAGHGSEGKPRRRRDRSLDSIVRVEAIRAERGIGAEGITFQDGRAGIASF